MPDVADINVYRHDFTNHNPSCRTMRLERDRQCEIRKHHLFRFPTEYRERSAVLLLSRHDRWQTGFAGGRHTVVHRRFPTRHLRAAVVQDFGCRREPLCADTIRHGRHTHSGMATRHRPLRSLLRSAPLTVVSLELTGIIAPCDRAGL